MKPIFVFWLDHDNKIIQTPTIDNYRHARAVYSFKSLVSALETLPTVEAVIINATDADRDRLSALKNRFVKTKFIYIEGIERRSFEKPEHLTEKKYRQLTRRQKEILSLLKLGHANKEIARHLSISEQTVKSHCKAIYEVLSVGNRTQASAIAHAYL